MRQRTVTPRGFLPRCLGLFGFLGLISCPVFAEEVALPQEAQGLLSKASTIETYRAQFILEAKEETGEPVRLEGRLSFKRPNQRRLEIKSGGQEEVAQLLVSDGKVEWQYYPAGNVVYRLDAPSETPGPHRAFAEIKSQTLRFIERRGQGPEAQLRFEAVPLPSVVEGAPVPIDTLRVDVGESDGLVRELVLLDAQGQSVLSQRYQGVEVNVSLPEGEFSFSVPSEAQVVELPPPPEEVEPAKP